jgi:hypothetical protein
LSEISKAREIQELKESGQLKARRSPGQRPHKLKDIRNYSSPDETDGDADADIVSEDS